MEELIEKMKTEGKDMDGNRIGSFGPASPETPDSKGSMSDGTRSSQETGIDVSRFIGSAFWRSLTNEVGINLLGPASILLRDLSEWLTNYRATGRRATADNE